MLSEKYDQPVDVAKEFADFLTPMLAYSTVSTNSWPICLRAPLDGQHAALVPCGRGSGYADTVLSLCAWIAAEARDGSTVLEAFLVAAEP